MKPFLFCLLVIMIAPGCKKNKTADKTNCDVTVPGIAGRFQLTKYESVSYNTGAAQNTTSTLSSCNHSGVYTFNADGTASYSESASCGSNATGTWSLANQTLLINLGVGDGNQINHTTITSWDCTNLVSMTTYPSVDSNKRFTLTRF